MTSFDLQDNDVLSWLKQHSDFFIRHPEALPDQNQGMQPPREVGGAASLASYQIDILRDKNKALNKKLHELIAIAEDNEQLVGRIHALLLRLFRAESLNDALSLLCASLVEDFHADHVVLALLHEHAPPDAANLPHVNIIAAHDAARDTLQQLMSQTQPFTGRLKPEQTQDIFGDAADRIESLAILTMPSTGMLAIGSHDNQRFFPGMGTLFLELLAETLNAALQRSWA